jgi:nucleoside 2-deoxyribosyltransferase
MKFYLASPLGFAESTQSFMNDLIDSLSESIDILNPWDDPRQAEALAAAMQLPGYDERVAALHSVNHSIGVGNVEKIDESDGIIAILDGVDVDSGTASEIGYGFGQGKVIYGLRTDFRLAGDNPGSIVNLQVQFFIEGSGGQVFTSVDDFLAFFERRLVGDQAT